MHLNITVIEKIIHNNDSSYKALSLVNISIARAHSGFDWIVLVEHVNVGKDE